MLLMMAQFSALTDGVTSIEDPLSLQVGKDCLEGLPRLLQGASQLLLASTAKVEFIRGTKPKINGMMLPSPLIIKGSKSALVQMKQCTLSIHLVTFSSGTIILGKKLQVTASRSMLPIETL